MWYKHMCETFAAMTGVSILTKRVLDLLIAFPHDIVLIDNLHCYYVGLYATLVLLFFLLVKDMCNFGDTSRKESANRYCFQGRSETDTKPTWFYFYKRRKSNYQFRGGKKMRNRRIYDSIFSVEF